eukprot:5947766-Lingulodinium_polyedra.AAC.1
MADVTLPHCSFPGASSTSAFSSPLSALPSGQYDSWQLRSIRGRPSPRLCCDHAGLAKPTPSASSD